MQETKAELRAGILAARRALAAEVRTAEAEALCARLVDLVRPGDTVCAYFPVGSEPGAPTMLDALVSAGAIVLLPVAREDAAGTPLPLLWGEYRKGGLVAAGHGLREPSPPWRPAEAIGAVALVVVPALAVDRSGTRLGRGAGFYDRSLPLADPSARLVAMLRDDEVFDALPGEPHDVPMTHALTPGRGLLALAEPPGMARPT
ncbi:5-formyltetrahydrofolate cyclo-ligase [Mycolicibacterium madagascariense]|uniref:5-formyltetrahydrofolate cyclo-ligase n=1 Tax=Mycolicibacterium madagascariense TaxID=212765 RepID=A0A7I7XMA8_9MYCO|nr:5-formyltetrahydrofolate cyclo-ligase [Mycolicibacterium madagascariense]MCV7012502.1 5-formyltetrahydrofolate cyclo-ligase [Mycolicibacterium madagascariense]BBZ30182.1 5-formyltetrahydrofolate cyclo-ligase [Mycolicibacterium madagascariense]